MRRARTPQEKKQLSLERDGRNRYGENAKSSRKNIPLAKAQVNRANRRAEHAVLDGGAGAFHAEAAERAELALMAKRPKRWRKQPDHRLGSVLARKRAPAGRRIRWSTQHLR